MTSKTISRTLKTTVAVGATATLMGLGLGAASAHVSADPTSTDANTYSAVSFAIGHGCNGSNTTSVAISLPAELNDATPTVNANWTIAKTTEKLAEPIKQANGSSITERTSVITYTAKAPLDAHQRDVLTLSLKVPDTAGKTLYFPTLQTCETGATNWADVPADGQDPESLKSPAPSLVVTAASAEGDGHGGHGAAATAGGGTTAAAETTATAANQTPAWIGLGAGVMGLVLGTVALFRTRKTSPAVATAVGSSGTGAAGK
ncbi:YcnI family copper-binding membrane protein [Arthrobacter sp. 35W]|uniref:YcnI family copper-binding membrane protein n=1 Tax=Arthrobacter sp. 35W TaxID=1132441 RepID=UPI000419B7F7|nr:YcnI family protein [Arthrobacter sp. 35W]